MLNLFLMIIDCSGPNCTFPLCKRMTVSTFSTPWNYHLLQRCETREENSYPVLLFVSVIVYDLKHFFDRFPSIFHTPWVSYIVFT